MSMCLSYKNSLERCSLLWAVRLKWLQISEGCQAMGSFLSCAILTFLCGGLGEQDIIPVFSATGLTNLSLLAFLGFTFCNFHGKDYFCRKRWSAQSTMAHNKGDAGLISDTTHFQNYLFVLCPWNPSVLSGRWGCSSWRSSKSNHKWRRGNVSCLVAMSHILAKTFLLMLGLSPPHTHPPFLQKDTEDCS